MKKITICLLLITSAFCATAQMPPSWFKFSAPDNTQNFDVKEIGTGIDTLGNIYTAASMYDTINNKTKAMLVKYNSAGVQQWIKFYAPSSTNNDTYVVSLLTDKGGNCFLCGYGHHNSTSGLDYMLLKYDNGGNQVFANYWDGGQNEADYPTCATFDIGGNILVAGYVNNQGTTGDDIGVSRWGISGTQQWTYVYNNTASNGEDRALAVTSDVNNNVYITGSTYGTNARNVITIKLNNAGVNQWTKIKPHTNTGSDEHGYGIAADVLGNSYITAATSEWETIKYDPTGTVVWSHVYNPNSLNLYNTKKVMIDKAGNVIVAGDAFFSGNNFSDLVVDKLSSSTGASMWSISVNNAGIDSFTDALLDSSGNVYVSGYFEGPLGADMSAMIISSAGAMIWQTTYSNGSNTGGGDRPYQLMIDKNRNLIMAGLSETRGSGSVNPADVITLKYSAVVTGIKENNKQTLYMGMYPNPARENIMLSVNDQSLLGSFITISTITGNMVVQEKLTALNQQITLGTLSKGVYLVKINNDKGSAVKKLVVE